MGINNDKTKLSIAALGSLPSIELSMQSISRADERMVECRVVNAATYNDLEYIMNDAYRETKKNLAEVGYQITKTEKELRMAKSRLILDEWNEYRKDKGLNDNAVNRDAFLSKSKEYEDLMDRVDALKAVEELLEGKIRVYENACRYMRKQIDILLRSGMIDDNKYVR